MLGSVPLQGDLENGLANIAFRDSLSWFWPSDQHASRAHSQHLSNPGQLELCARNHQLKAGVNFTYQRSPKKSLPNANGAFTFDDWGTFAANTPYSTSITLGNPSLDFREYDSFYDFR